MKRPVTKQGALARPSSAQHRMPLMLSLAITLMETEHQNTLSTMVALVMEWPVVRPSALTIA